jgi:hypothetical protein
MRARTRHATAVLVSLACLTLTSGCITQSIYRDLIDTKAGPADRVEWERLLLHEQPDGVVTLDAYIRTKRDDLWHLAAANVDSRAVTLRHIEDVEEPRADESSRSAFLSVAPVGTYILVGSHVRPVARDGRLEEARPLTAEEAASEAILSGQLLAFFPPKGGRTLVELDGELVVSLEGDQIFKWGMPRLPGERRLLEFIVVLPFAVIADVVIGVLMHAPGPLIGG